MHAEKRKGESQTSLLTCVSGRKEELRVIGLGGGEGTPNAEKQAGRLGKGY